MYSIVYSTVYSIMYSTVYFVSPAPPSSAQCALSRARQGPPRAPGSASTYLRQCCMHVWPNGLILPQASGTASTALNTLHCILDTVHTVYTIQCTVYTVHCTLYTVHCTVHTGHCTLLSVQCTPSQQRYTILFPLLAGHSETRYSAYNAPPWQAEPHN